MYSTDNSPLIREPLVSVILPTHNRARLLPRAIKSVLSQTLTDLELIIIDDASTDDTSVVIRSFSDGRVRHIRHEQPHGSAGARNAGIHAAKGQLVAFLDDDDEWLPEKLERQSALFMNDSDGSLGVVMCGSRIVGAGAVHDHIPRPRGWVRNELLRFKCHTTTSTLLIRKSALGRIGGFDESYPAFEEWDLLVRLAKEYRFDHVAEALHIYYHHDGERVSKPSNEIRAMQIILKKYAYELAAQPQLLALHNYKLARMYMRAGQLPEARVHLAASLRAAPLNTKRWVLLFLTMLDAEIFRRSYRVYINLSRLKRGLYRRVAM